MKPPIDKEAIRRASAELARDLRAQLVWQSELGADGSPRADPQALVDLDSLIRRKRLGDTLGDASRRPPTTSEPQERGRHHTGPPAGVASTPRAAASPYQAIQALASPRDDRPGADRIAANARLDAVRKDLGDCQRCKLCKTRRNIVFGVGDPTADLVFVGEAPGVNEDRKGEPFVGRAGQLLDRMIGAMGLSRSSVYILNIIKCRPPGNRDPEPDEMAACEPFLRKQLDALEPTVIVTLGRFAAQSLLRTGSGISRLRGRWHEYHGIRLMPTFHPAYLLRHEDRKREVWNDLQLVMKELGLPAR